MNEGTEIALEKRTRVGGKICEITDKHQRERERESERKVSSSSSLP